MAMEINLLGLSGSKIEVDAGGRAETYMPAQTVTATLAALNAVASIVCEGDSTVALDLRGTFSLTAQVQGTVDGTNWQIIPVRPLGVASVLYVASVTGTTAGTWIGQCAGYKQVRVLVTAFTSGSTSATLSSSNAAFNDLQTGLVTPILGTNVGAAGAAVTLTLASPGAGLRQYLTYMSINRFATALLTAAAAPVTVTTTNLPGSLAFSFGAEAALQGTLDRWREDFAYPLAAAAQGTAVTVVCPATTGVIWRVTAGYYVAP